MFIETDLITNILPYWDLWTVNIIIIKPTVTGLENLLFVLWFIVVILINTSEVKFERPLQGGGGVKIHLALIIIN